MRVSPPPVCPLCLEREGRTVLLHSDGEPHSDWHCDECYAKFRRGVDGTLERKPLEPET